MYSYRGIVIITISNLLLGCITPGYIEEMQPDGNSWKVTYIGGVSDKCYGGFTSDDAACANSLKPFVIKRATELCGGQPERIYACGRPGSQNAVKCVVECKKSSQEIKEAQIPANEVKNSLGPDKSAIEKAKKCQAKGGVWVNDVCQIDVE